MPIKTTRRNVAKDHRTEWLMSHKGRKTDNTFHGQNLPHPILFFCNQKYQPHTKHINTKIIMASRSYASKFFRYDRTRYLDTSPLPNTPFHRKLSFKVKSIRSQVKKNCNDIIHMPYQRNHSKDIHLGSAVQQRHCACALKSL